LGQAALTATRLSHTSQGYPLPRLELPGEGGGLKSCRRTIFPSPGREGRKRTGKEKIRVWW